MKVGEFDLGDKPHIFIDLDDTVADFRKSAESILERELSANCRDITVDEWDKIAQFENFYCDMELTDGALDLLNYCKIVEGYSVAYLGALPGRLNREWAIKSKNQWIFKNFLMFPFYVDSSHDKQRFAKGNILIDDKQFIIDQWNYAEGYGIVCQNCHQAKEDLENYLKTFATLK